MDDADSSRLQAPITPILSLILLEVWADLDGGAFRSTLAKQSADYADFLFDLACGRNWTAGTWER
jgi:hypothetical protein